MPFIVLNQIEKLKVIYFHSTMPDILKTCVLSRISYSLFFDTFLVDILC